jgi:GT2 family glycosyltransferase
MDPQPPAPPVVAVVVTSDAGPWLEEALASLAAQDYPALSVLVIDAASREDPTPRVAAVLPGAYIRRLPANPGFAAAANEVLGMVEGAAFYAFCHDDVALAPDALRLLVEEAVRSNAGVVGPKLVDWDQPQRLLQVGLSADFAGVPANLVERGELDQEQHDAVRDVLAVPGGVMLVRADLFAALGGFDPTMTLHNEDLDLCWRANIAGARVLVAPDAVVRHLEALARRRPDDDRRRLQMRHRLRTALKCHGPLALVAVIPRLVVTHLAEALYALVAGRRAQAADVARAWWWNLANWRSLFRARRAVQRARRVPDRDVRRLQVRGSARLAAFLRGHGGEDRAMALAAAGRDLLASLRSGPRRLAVGVWLAVAVVLALGSRGLLTGRIPAVGDIVALPDHAGELLRHWAGGWRQVGLGGDEPAPTAFGLLGLAGLALAGGTGVLQKVLVLGALPVGAVGVWRLTRPLAAGSPVARLAAVVLYLSVPLPYNALAGGRWGALVAYAVTPYLIARLATATGLAPWDGDARPLVRQAVPVALVLAAAGALAPAVVPVTLVVAAGLALGSVVAGSLLRAGRAVALALVAGVGALVLCVPWSFTFVLPGAEWAQVAGPGAAAGQATGLGALIRFETGPWGAAPLGWAVVIAAMLPLLIGREWRLAWATRMWGVALTSWGLAWAGVRGWLPVATPDTGVLLAPAAVALALATALGAVAFVTDLRGYHFGWRQAVSVAAACAGGLATLPVLGAAVGGRWGMPADDWSRALAWMRTDRGRGEARVLWVGDPAVLPGEPWPLDDRLAYGLSRNGAPTVLDRWVPAAGGATRLVADAVTVARRGGTTRLGRLLAPMAVRYVAVPMRAAPGAGPLHRPPADLLAALAGQLDLRRRPSDPGLVLYENVAAAPVRGIVPGAVPPEAPTAGADLSRARPVLQRGAGPTRASGRIDRSGTVLLSEAYSTRWELRVDGRPAHRERGFGWANAFRVEAPGPAELRYRTPPAYLGLLALQVVLWAGAIRWARRGRRRTERSSASPEEPAIAAGVAA